MSAKGIDKNTIIGLMIIGAILLIFSYITKPSKEEIEASKKEELIKKNETDSASKKSPIIAIDDTINHTTNISDTNKVETNDSIKNINALAEYGVFANNINKKEEHFTIENSKIKITLSNKGGRITSVELKNFHTYDSLPLILFHKDSSSFNLELTAKGLAGGSTIQSINTKDLYFETTDNSFNVKDGDSKSFAFRLYTTNRDKYLELKYTLKAEVFTTDFDLKTVGFNTILAEQSPIYLNWSMFTPNQEKTIKNQAQTSTIYYKYNKDKVDYISPMKYTTEAMETSIDWVMFKQQYFNSAIIAKKVPFLNSDSKLSTIKIPEGITKNYVKGMEANLTIPYNGLPNENFAMEFYFGPNKYKTLKALNVGLEDSKNYGWSIFGWVSKHFIRPVFEFLNNFGLPVGITILLLTLVIKSLLFPITWKTYVSSAKMRVLKPEIEELTAKFKNDKVKKQQATMALYRQTGVNPLAGCIPMLIQMPILFALFRFFPATFELRQKSFLWAQDLSTYDSIYDFPNHFSIPFYGDHISLFTLLMAISMIFYTKVNSQMTAGTGMEGPMAGQMKIMTYLMPVMMLFFFNNYAAGLSLYYLIANIITITQQIIIRKWIVDEDKIHAKLQANKTKKKKKSGLAAKLEQRMKEAQALQQQKKKK